jgi:hypothetical protein
MLAEVAVTFMNVTLGAPVVRAAATITGGLGVAGARFVLDGGLSAARRGNYLRAARLMR